MIRIIEFKTYIYKLIKNKSKYEGVNFIYLNNLIHFLRNRFRCFFNKYILHSRNNFQKNSSNMCNKALHFEC